jgi:dihydropteroate synthase
MLKNKSMQIGKTKFKWGTKTYVMGILNITPDSFSGDGLLGKENIQEAVIAQAISFVNAGADILDIGGESTRPGSEEISAQEEADRVLPLIESLRKTIDIPLSIDSYKSKIADEALMLGANVINDVWALRADANMAAVAKKHDAPIILMHNRSAAKNTAFEEKLGGRYVGMEYNNLIEDIKSELLSSVDLAITAGIEMNKIILDTGIGFGKTVQQNLELLNRGDEIRQLGYPLLIGPSRKSFIGYTLDATPENRLEGTAATVSVAITRGADIVRVHDVEAMVKIAKMTDAITRNLVGNV